MQIRSASDSLKGYFYQFDKTILTLLFADSTNIITVEGIEDIDIASPTLITAIQCKYLESRAFTNSAIRKPILLMLDHYINNPQGYNYNLYTYFPHEATRKETIDLDRLKDILTYKETGKHTAYYKDKSISDETLEKFLKCFQIQIGQSYDEQKQEVFKKIKEEFSFSDIEVVVIYYNKTLRFIYILYVLP